MTGGLWNTLDWSRILQDLGAFFTQPAPGGLMFCSMGFWALFTVFFFLYIFCKKWNRTAMLLYVIAFDLFFFYKANGLLMLLLPATAAVTYYLTEQIRRSSRRMTDSDGADLAAGAMRRRCGGRSGNWFFGKPVRERSEVRISGPAGPGTLRTQSRKGA